MRGTILAIVESKGFGFIKDENGEHRFFHTRHLVGITFDRLTVGQAVTFTPGVNDRVDAKGAKKGNGLIATEVQVAA